MEAVLPQFPFFLVVLLLLMRAILILPYSSFRDPCYLNFAPAGANNASNLTFISQLARDGELFLERPTKPVVPV